jgi:beta-hydroxyacyl-ACP dehydratase FabZ
MAQPLNIEEIFKVLPQRFPFIMIDRVAELEPDKRIVAIKNVSFNEEFFSGHFPGKPIMPGVLIVEAMAQSAIVMLCSDKPAVKELKLTYYLGSVKVRFLHPVTPGDQLRITVEPLKIVKNAAIVSARAEVLGREVASGELAFMVKADEK